MGGDDDGEDDDDQNLMEEEVDKSLHLKVQLEQRFLGAKEKCNNPESGDGGK